METFQAGVHGEIQATRAEIYSGTTRPVSDGAETQAEQHDMLQPTSSAPHRQPLQPW